MLLTDLTTPQDCDSAILALTSIKKTLEKSVLAKEDRIESSQTSKTNLESTLQSLTVERDTLSTIIPTLPTGETKTKFQDRVIILNANIDIKNVALSKVSKGRIYAYIQELTALQANLSSIIANITAIENHKLSL